MPGRAWSSLTGHLCVELLTNPVCHLRTERDSWCSSIWHPRSSRPPPAVSFSICSASHSSALHGSRQLCDFWDLESGHSPLTHQSPHCVHRAPLNVLSGLHGWLRGAVKAATGGEGFALAHPRAPPHVHLLSRPLVV